LSVLICGGSWILAVALLGGSGLISNEPEAR
jgi:hypothetical protein